MIGSLVYITLDVGLNIGIWTTKKVYNGLYYTGYYMLGSTESEINSSSNNKIDKDISQLIKAVEEQKKEISELSEFLHSN